MSVEPKSNGTASMYLRPDLDNRMGTAQLQTLTCTVRGNIGPLLYIDGTNTQLKHQVRYVCAASDTKFPENT
jgi:hypothetical protein